MENVLCDTAAHSGEHALKCSLPPWSMDCQDGYLLKYFIPFLPRQNELPLTLAGGKEESEKPHKTSFYHVCIKDLVRKLNWRTGVKTAGWKWRGSALQNTRLCASVLDKMIFMVDWTIGTMVETLGFWLQFRSGLFTGRIQWQQLALWKGYMWLTSEYNILKQVCHFVYLSTHQKHSDI